MVVRKKWMMAIGSNSISKKPLGARKTFQFMPWFMQPATKPNGESRSSQPELLKISNHSAQSIITIKYFIAAHLFSAITAQMVGQPDHNI